jgi:hypothetical protein
VIAEPKRVIAEPTPAAPQWTRVIAKTEPTITRLAMMAIPTAAKTARNRHTPERVTQCSMLRNK